MPGAFMKNEQQSPKAEASILFFGCMLVLGMQVWGGGDISLPGQEGWMLLASVGSKWTLLIYTSHAPDLQHICYEIAVKKRLSEQMTPQLLHKGHHPAMCTHTHTSHHLLALEDCLPVTIGYDWGPGTLAPKSAEVGLVILAFMSSNPPANDAMAEYSVAWKKKQKAF